MPLNKFTFVIACRDPTFDYRINEEIVEEEKRDNYAIMLSVEWLESRESAEGVLSSD